MHNFCPPGSYGDAMSLAADCKQCSAGKHGPTPGQLAAVCTDCFTGMWNDRNGSRECKPCASGMYQPNMGRLVCDACPDGEYQQEKGKQFCFPCNPGRFSAESASTECAACAAGQYQDQAGKNICNDCDAGKATNTTGSSKCDECGTGMYQPDTGMPTCMKCNRGRFTDRKGQQSCTACDAGEFAEEEGLSRCAQCNAGTYASQVGSAECAPCPSGTFSNSQGSRNCTIVTPGFVIGDGNTSQIECGPGTFSAPNKLKCLDCPIETYQPSYGASECAQCKPGQTTTTNGSRACISKQCNFYTEYLDMSRGKSFDDWECVVCPDGGSCIGDNVVKDDIMAKQGYWRVPNTISFSQCLVKDACVGVGEETTVTSANSTEKAIEQCNEEIGYKENCTNYATRATERCRLCTACASGFKRVGSRGQCVPIVGRTV